MRTGHECSIPVTQSCASPILQIPKHSSAGDNYKRLPNVVCGFDKYLKRNEDDPSRVGMIRLNELLKLLRPHFGFLKPNYSSDTELNKPHCTILDLPLNIGEVRSALGTSKAGKQEAALKATHLIEEKMKARKLLLIVPSDSSRSIDGDQNKSSNIKLLDCATLNEIRDIPCFSNGAGDWMPQEVYDPPVIAELTRKIEEQVALGLSVGSAAFQEVGMVLNDIFVKRRANSPQLGGTAPPVRRPRSSTTAFGEVWREGDVERRILENSMQSGVTYGRSNDYWKSHPPRDPPPVYSPPRRGPWSMPSEREYETSPECRGRARQEIPNRIETRNPEQPNADGSKNENRRKRAPKLPVGPSQGFGGEPYNDPCRTYVKEEPGEESR